MGDHDDSFSNEESNFLELSSLVFSDSGESESDYDAREYFDGIDFVVPVALLNRFPSEDPMLALEIALIEQSLLASQAKISQAASGLTPHPNLGYQDGQPVPRMLEFGRLLMPYYINYIQMIHDSTSENSGQENVHSSSDTASVPYMN